MEEISSPSTRPSAREAKRDDVAASNGAKRSGGLKIERRYTTEGQDPLEQIEYTFRKTRITDPDGTVVFEMENIEVPADWSQLATDIMASKYFRKAGVPQYNDDGTPMHDDKGNPILGAETSAKQVVRRLTSCWRWWGEQYGYFDTEADAQAFEDELNYMLMTQMAAPNSPQWFN
ncbi:MAG: vitamin B12-dependent ribonucleotide reductase, partial [Planctomycetes bacterium]|nr:vitamin B12-dependent ribonucleotide reductase [Planctomycetota bacterium]